MKVVLNVKKAVLVHVMVAVALEKKHALRIHGVIVLLLNQLMRYVMGWIMIVIV